MKQIDDTSPRRSKPTNDWIGVVEATYQLELPELDWMSGIMQAAAGVFESDRGIAMTLYDASDRLRFRLHRISALGCTDGWIQSGIEGLSAPETAEHIVERHRRTVCATSDEFTTSMAPLVREIMRHHGIQEGIVMNGIDPSYIGATLHCFSGREISMTAERRAQCERIALHLATAFRLRRRLAQAAAILDSVHPEAVFRPDGQLTHAEGVADDKRVRETLTDAVQRREWARSQAHRASSQALSGWQAMVSARWTLVDYYPTVHQRMIVARQNVPVVRQQVCLTPREAEVTAFAALGRSNKLIAYELGLSHSTVRVLLARAASKLGVATRAALIESYRQQADRPDGDSPMS